MHQADQPGVIEKTGDGTRPAGGQQKRERQGDVSRSQKQEWNCPCWNPGAAHGYRSIHSTKRGGASSVVTYRVHVSGMLEAVPWRMMVRSLTISSTKVAVGVMAVSPRRRHAVRFGIAGKLVLGELVDARALIAHHRERRLVADDALFRLADELDLQFPGSILPVEAVNGRARLAFFHPCIVVHDEHGTHQEMILHAHRIQEVHDRPLLRRLVRAGGRNAT